MTSAINGGLNPIDIPSSPGTPQNNNLLFGDSIGSSPKPTALSIPITEYTNLVGTARYKNAQELNDIQITSPMLLTALADSFTALSQALSQLKTRALKAYELWVASNSSKNSVDSAITSYNDAVAQASNTYNGSPKTPSDLQAYNNAIANAASAYTASTKPYNDAVNALNLNGFSFSDSPSLAPSVPTPPSPPPTAPPFTSISPFTVVEPPATSELFVSIYFIPAAQSSAQANALLLDQLNTSKGYLEAQSTELNTTDITLPVAYITRSYPILLSGPSKADTGGNSVYSSMSVGLSNVNFATILSQPIYNDSLQEAANDAHPTPGLSTVESGVAERLPKNLRAKPTEMPNVPVSISYVDLIGDLQKQNLQLLLQATQAAASQTLQLLPVKSGGPDLSSPAFDSISSLAFAKAIHNLVNSDSINNNIKDLIAKNTHLQNLSEEQQNELVDQLAAAQKLNLLQQGISQVSIAFKIPGLASQIFGNALSHTPGLPNIATFLQKQPGEPLNNVLQNPFSQTSLKENLSQALQDYQTAQAHSTSLSELAAIGTGSRLGSASEGVSELGNSSAHLSFPLTGEVNPAVRSLPTDSWAINQAVNQVTQQSSKQSVQNEQELHAQFLNAFSNAGFSTPTAAVLAQTATTQVKAESALPFLGLAYTPDQLRKALNADPNFSIEGLNPTENQNVKNALIGVSQQNPGNNQFASGDNPQEKIFASYAELHRRLIKELTSSQISQTNAETLANQAIVFLKPKPDAVDSSKNQNVELTGYARENAALSFKQLPPQVLAEQLHATIVDKLTQTNGKYAAKAIADQFVANTVGANSIQTQLAEQLSVIKEIHDETVLHELGKNIRMLGSPNVPLYVIKEINDQALRFQAGAPRPSYVDPATGSLQSDQEAAQPLNFKRDISIKI